MRLEKILLPVDFSESVIGSARYARALACRFHSEVTIAHVFEYQNLMFSGETGVPPQWYEEARQDSQRLLDRCCAEEFHDMPLRRVMLDGDVARSITELAHNEHVDLIVVPTHGYGGFRRFLLGSVTAKLLHDADCPILTGIHMQQTPSMAPVSFRNIICAVDFDAAGEKAFAWAAAFAGEFQSRLTLVHALPPMDAGQAHYFDQGLPVMLQNLARQRMDELRERTGAAAGVILEQGRVAGVVQEAAASTNADLVVIGRHENAGILGRLRSNSYAIVRESPCPVVSV